ncbi:MAG: hypothetical protein KQ78_01865 [Candidatus Izimaplasma bacterium HR2]|nr:MAG: hypothetical protein KQ78_01865 [Candidatus Izimaplasma bacterium HR2]
MLGDINYLIGPIEYELMLTKPNKEPIIAISNDYGKVYNPSMIAVDEFSFNIDKYYSDGSINDSYNKIKEKLLIRLNQQEFFVIIGIEEDEVNGIKEIICYSLEFELSQKFIQVYEVTSAKLYSDNSDIPGVMNLINSLAPSWTVGTIDSEILTKYRSFDVSNIDIRSFIIKNIQEAYGCIAIFNTDDKTIDFKLLENIGTNKSLYLSTENLINELTRNRKLENLATRVYGFGSEDLTMNTVNPNAGKSYIDNWSYFRNRDWMSQGLIDALDAHDVIVAANITEFQTVLAEYQAEFEDKYGSNTNNTLLATLISGTNITFDDNASDLDSYYNGWELLIDAPSSTNLDCVGQTATIVSYNGTTKIATIDSAFSIVQHTYQTVQVTVIDIPENPVGEEVYAEGVYFISEDIGNYRFLQVTLSKQAYFQEYEIALIAKHASITPTQDDLDELAETRTHLDYWNGQVTTYQALVDANDTVLDTKTTRLQELNVIMDIETNLTFAQLQELDPYIIETTHTNTTIIDETDLYDEVKEISDRMAYPRYEFSLNAADFLKMVEYQHIRHRLNTGDIINVKVSDTEVVEVRLLSYTHDFDEDGLEMTFSSVNSILDATYELAEILNSTSSSANTLNVERFKYKTYIDNDQNTIYQFMNSYLDAANNAVKAGNNQEVIIDRTGITMREFDLLTGGYKDSQMRLINNTIAITDDNWNTVKTAISPTGVFADVLVGRAILGTEFQIEAADGTFTVDDLGTVIKNMSLTAVKDEGLGTERKIVLNDTDVIRVSIGEVDKLWIDSSGDLNITGNINMSASSTISWDNITDGDIEAKAAAFDGTTYSTYIGSDGIYTGTLIANKILTGTLGAPGSTLTLTSNVVIGSGFSIAWTDVTNSDASAVLAYEGTYIDGNGVYTGEVKADKLIGHELYIGDPLDLYTTRFIEFSSGIKIISDSSGTGILKFTADRTDICYDGNYLNIGHNSMVGDIVCQGDWDFTNATVSGISSGVGGSNSFLGNGSGRTVTHGLGSTPSSVTITADGDPNGWLGEV